MLGILKGKRKEQYLYLIKKIIMELSWASFVLLRRTKSKLLFIRRLLIKPKLPRNPDGKILIHLGCGDIACSEFVNVDSRPAPHVHYVCDIRDLSIFPDNYAHLIYACHVLEHVPKRDLRKTLWEWRRILQPGGILRLSVPDFDKLLHIYESCSHDINIILDMLMGGQDNKYDIHYSAFNNRYLFEKLTEVGFREIRQWDPAQVDHHDFEDMANLKVRKDGMEFLVSLNLEAAK